MDTKISHFSKNFTPCVIGTRDTWIRSSVLYPTELMGHHAFKVCFFCTIHERTKPKCTKTRLIMSCTCVFCTSTPCDTLPVPILVVHPQQTFWVWMTSSTPMRLHITVTNHRHGGVYSKPLHSFLHAVQFVTNKVNVDLSTTHMLVKTMSGELVPIQDLDQCFQNRKVGPPSHIGDSCFCKRYIFREIMDTTETVPLAMAVPQGRRRAKKRTSGSVSPCSKKACTGTDGSDTMIARLLRPLCVADDDEYKEKRRSQGPVVEEDQRGEIDGGGRYHLLERGGSASHIRNILAVRPVWDEETVEELLRWGGRPQLHGVHNVFESKWFTRVRCTFVHPSGALVRDIWLPLSILKAKYPDETVHL